LITRVDAPENEWSSVPDMNRSPSGSSLRAVAGDTPYEAIINHARFDLSVSK